MVRPVIALLTDFGTRDHYVGVMKGVIAGICPEAVTIDLTHAVPPQDITAAAFTLAAAWRDFPEGSIFVTVIDPGVGTRRPAVAAQIGGCRFVAPDNGVLDLVVASAPVMAAVSIDDRRFVRPTSSATFEGRDRFAPAAAWLAAGTPLGELGPPVTLGVRGDWPQPEVRDGRLHGVVLHVDHFGNLVTNLERTAWPSWLAGGEVWVGHRGPFPLVRTYGDAPAGTIVGLVGSTERLEVARVLGSAAATLDADRGADVCITGRA